MVPIKTCTQLNIRGRKAQQLECQSGALEMEVQFVALQDASCVTLGKLFCLAGYAYPAAGSKLPSSGRQIHANSAKNGSVDIAAEMVAWASRLSMDSPYPLDLSLSCQLILQHPNCYFQYASSSQATRSLSTQAERLTLNCSVDMPVVPLFPIYKMGLILPCLTGINMVKIVRHSDTVVMEVI